MTVQNNPFQIVDPTIDPAEDGPVGPQVVQQASSNGSSSAPPAVVPVPTPVVVPIPAQAAAAATAIPAVAVQAPTVTPLAPLPTFEGKRVDRSHVQVTGRAEVGLDDDVLMIDDLVRLVGEFRVVAVGFKADPKTGDMVRLHMVKPTSDMQLTPWDPQDANDSGIQRAK